MKKIDYQIIQGNCLEEMDKIHHKNGEFVDFIFADPPYFLSNGGMTCKNGKMVKEKNKYRIVKGGDNNTSKGFLIPIEDLIK